MNNNDMDTKPWYRQFWPWFIIALPLSAVIAGIITLVIALKNPDHLVVDPATYEQIQAENRAQTRPAKSESGDASEQ